MTSQVKVVIERRKEIKDPVAINKHFEKIELLYMVVDVLRKVLDYMERNDAANALAELDDALSILISSTVSKTSFVQNLINIINIVEKPIVENGVIFIF